MLKTAGKSVTFYYDIVCPFAYLAAHRLRHWENISWTPVVLGGIYKETSAPQGKDGSATDVMSEAKKKLFVADLMREYERAALPPLQLPPSHPIMGVSRESQLRTLDALRLIVASPESKRVQLSLELYRRAYQQGEDIGDTSVLRDAAHACGVPSMDEFGDSEQAVRSSASAQLRQNTAEAVAHGAFGVPSFWVNQRLYYGQDRLHMVAREAFSASSPLAQLPRLHQPPPPPETEVGGQRSEESSRQPTLEFFFDFASPYAYLGYSQVHRLAREAGARLVLRPILLGALFKGIGTPNLPMLAMGEAKRKYMQQDLQDWARWWRVPLQWPANFPIRTVTACRVALLEPAACDVIFNACWGAGAGGGDVSDDSVLEQVLTAGGFDGAGLVQRASSDQAVKNELRRNTERAAGYGVVGVPTYRIVAGGSWEGGGGSGGGGGDNEGEEKERWGENGGGGGGQGGVLIWGQDRMHVVADLLADRSNGSSSGGGGEEDNNSNGITQSSVPGGGAGISKL